MSPRKPKPEELRYVAALLQLTSPPKRKPKGEPIGFKGSAQSLAEEPEWDGITPELQALMEGPW